MTRAELENSIREVLQSLDDSELVSIHNGYNEANRRYDDDIYSMDLFDEIYANYEPSEVATRVFYGHDEWNDESSFNPNREWFYLNGYGNPVSIDYVGYNEYADKFMCPLVDVAGIIDYIIETEDALDNDEIQDLLDEYGEENALPFC